MTKLISKLLQALRARAKQRLLRVSPKEHTLIVHGLEALLTDPKSKKNSLKFRRHSITESGEYDRAQIKGLIKRLET